MPLAPAHERDLIHTRTMDLKAYRRSDGHFDVEGHITDVKPFPHHLIDSHRTAGEPIHDMWLRLTIDKEMVVLSAEAKLDVGAHVMCPGVEPNFAALAGLKVGSGWRKGVRDRVGAGRGCTHLVEMLSQMATAAIQAMWAVREPDGDGAKTANERRLPEGLVGSCYTYRAGSEFLRDYFPSQYDAGG
jgi:hypothetical protein